MPNEDGALHITYNGEIFNHADLRPALEQAGIKVVVTDKGDVKTLETPAKAMARWIRQFPTQFPKGTEEGHNTKALPAVWTDNEGFRKTANELAEASTKLAELAKAGDADGVAAQVKAMGDICAACHRTYRAR